MSPRLTNILLGVALLGCGISAYHWHNQFQSVQANLDELKTERDRLNRRIAELKAVQRSPLEPVIQPRAPESPYARSSGRPSFSPGENSGPPPEAFRGGDGRDRFMAMLDNPEIQKLMNIQQKAALDSRFAGLFRSLNLSPADLEKFKALLVDKQVAAVDARAAARAQGLTGPENREALQQVIANAQTEVDNSIRSTLGEAVFAQYKAYEQTQPERNLVTQLQQRLSYSSAPLTDTQSNQVIGLMAASHPTPPAPITDTRNNFPQFRNGGATTTIPITDAVIAGSQSILTSTQLAALTQLQQEQKAQAQLVDQMRAARQSSNTMTANGSKPLIPTGKP